MFNLHGTIRTMKKILIITLLMVFLPLTVFAGGGRILIYTSDNFNGYYYVNSDTYVLAQVFVPDSSNTVSSVGERAEFRIENPREGDSCVNEIEQTTELGLLRARCKATQPGTITVYVYSFADNYESSRYQLHFYAMPNPTDDSTQPPVASPTLVRSTPTPTHALNKTITKIPLELSPTPASISELNAVSVLSEEELDTKLESEFTQNSESMAIVLSLALIMFGISIAGVGFLIFMSSKKT